MLIFEKLDKSNVTIVNVNTIVSFVAYTEEHELYAYFFGDSNEAWMRWRTDEWVLIKYNKNNELAEHVAEQWRAMGGKIRGE